MERASAPIENVGRRRRVLIGAYACGPVAEPEARAGWEFARAAAQDHDTWVITRHRFRAPIEEALAAEPQLRQSLHVLYLDLAPRVVRLKRRSWDLYWYYPMWQRALARRARQLHANTAFDVLHHVTFANDWMPSGLASVEDVPLVWGPVGGASAPPIWRLSRWLGVRGTLTELLRGSVTSFIRRFTGDPIARRARIVVAQNHQVAQHFAKVGARVVVEPNATLDALPARSTTIAPRTAVFAGRLLGLKGAALAIDTIAHEKAAGWTLQIFGAGYEEARLRRRVDRLGVAHRVEFRGHRPRAEVLEAIAGAEVFLFPSMRDQAGWVVAEASSIGCPVVCLPLGGPPALAEPNGHIASLDGDIVANLAQKLNEAAAAGGHPTDRWSVDRLPGIVSGWYADAAGEPAVASAPVTKVRVLESFGVPKPTTNPYISQLYSWLDGQPEITVLPYTYRTALFGRYDVVHLHWPELMVDGHNWRGRAVRRILTSATVVRWKITRVPVVRTVHNLERPSGISRLDHRILDRIDAATSLDVRLNRHSPTRAGKTAVTIPHGHYRDWFRVPASTVPTPGRIGYVGLIRRYKGVDELVRAFRDLDDPGASLHIAGRPSSADLVKSIEDAARADPRVSLTAKFLDDDEWVEAIVSSQVVVLPYRHMHNSGTVLAVLSLDRPVLVPENDVNRELSEEVGPGWVHMFSGTLTAADLERALRDSPARSERPELSLRDWDVSAEDHVTALRRAIDERTRMM